MQPASWATLIFEHNPRFKQQQRILLRESSMPSTT
jgi:hypothetical protein